MSNRIDELVSVAMTLLPRCTTCVPRDNDPTCQRCTALRELAAVARKSAGVPEHIALMEAEHRAVEKYFVAFDYLGVAGSLGDVSPAIPRMAHRETYEAREMMKIAHEAISTYRKENGYV